MSFSYSLNTLVLTHDNFRITYVNQLVYESLYFIIGSKLDKLVMLLTQNDLINSLILKKYLKVFSIYKKEIF